MSCMVLHLIKQQKSALLYHQKAKPDQIPHTNHINWCVQGL